MDSNEAAEYIDDDSLDFIFLDAYLTGEQAKNDLEVWYPKVKTVTSHALLMVPLS